MASRVTGPREARAAVVALRSVDADVRKEVMKQTRTTLNPIWNQEVDKRVHRKMDDRILATGVRVTTGAKPVLKAANSKKALKNGLVPVETWRAWEFGSQKRNKATTYTRRSPKGKSHNVTRRTQRQVPYFKKSGRVLYPAIAESAPRILALWTQTTIRKIMEALEKGES